jgi:glycosyltransferase involved in cell wall biosynthesis
LQQVPSEEFDVAIAYQQGLPTYLVASKVRSRKKIAWVNVNIFNAGYSASFNSVFYDKMDFVVPVSKELETILQETYPQFSRKYVCIYDILNPELIRRNANEPIPEQELFNKSVTLVTVGRLAVQKNYLLAVEAAKILNEKGIDFKWIFVGEGSERPHIEQRIAQYGLEQRVVLLGLRTNPYPYMKHCSVYVQTSSFEGFGLTIAEAKILGKPVVSTDFDVVHDQIVHGQNGLIAEMTATSVAEQIIKMLTDESLLNHIIENVRNEKNNTYRTEVIKAERIFDED